MPVDLPTSRAKQWPSLTAVPQRRIAFVGGRGVGGQYSGIETFYEEVGSRLAARGHEVTVYCRPHFTPQVDSYLGMRVVRLPAPRSKHLETLIHSLLSSVHAMFRAFDIVHIHAIGSAVFAWLPRVSGKRTVVTVHALDYQRPKWGRFAQACLRGSEWASVRFPSFTVAVSESVATHLREEYGTHIGMIHNGVRMPIETGMQNLGRLGLTPYRYVLFSGRLSEEKGCDQLIEAFQRAATQGTELVLAGGATYASEFEKRLHAMAGSHVRFLGWVDQATLAELYAHCALYVLPSSLEGLSVALLEAMSHGAAILASDIEPNVEALGGTGWTFRQGDRADLSRQLSACLADPVALRAAGDRARRRAREHFSWDATVLKLEKVYEDVLAGSI